MRSGKFKGWELFCICEDAGFTIASWGYIKFAVGKFGRSLIVGSYIFPCCPGVLALNEVEGSEVYQTFSSNFTSCK